MENMKEKMSAFATHLAESLPNDYGIDLFDVAVNHFQWSFPTLNKKDKKDSTIKCPSIVHYFDDAFNKKAIGQVNQKIIFARLAISQGYRQKIDPYVPEEIAYFSRQWAGTHRVNVVNYVNFLTKVQPCIDNLNIEEILHILANEAKGLDHIASWSQMLAAINPSNCFVYDSRIHQPLRLFWSLYRPNESYPLLTGVAHGRENSRAEKLRIKLDSLNVAPLKRAAKGQKQSLIIESYCAYCCFIKELSRLTIEESAKSNKIGWTDTDIFAENKKSIYLQLTEMGLFALLGRGKGNPGFLGKAKKALDDKLVKFQ